MPANNIFYYSYTLLFSPDEMDRCKKKFYLIQIGISYEILQSKFVIEALVKLFHAQNS